MKTRTRQSGAIIIIALIAVAANSCIKDNAFEESENEKIQNYLDLNDYDVEPLESGLYYIELIRGTGPKPVDGDTVEVYYTGKFLSGRVFNSNIDGNIFEFVVGDEFIIEGWNEGIQYMNEGAEALLIIPSWLAYGPSGTFGIPGYTPLLYEISLEKVIPGQ